VRHGKRRVEPDCIRKAALRTVKAVWRPAEKVVTGLQIAAIRIDTLGRRSSTGKTGPGQLKPAGDVSGDLVLDNEHVARVALVTLAPDLAMIPDAHQMCGYPKPLARLSDAAFYRMRHTQTPADPGDVATPGMSCKRRGP
jgi:hypothetical protein